MAAYHVECFEGKTGKTGVRGFPSKWDTKCGICDGEIRKGGLITWTRRGQTLENANGASSASVSDAEFTDITPPMLPAAPTAGIIGIDLAGLASALVPHLEGRFAASSDDQPNPVHTIEVKNLDTQHTVDLGFQHARFPELLKLASARVNTWIAGPSGSGKTSAAIAIAKALSLDFYYDGAVGDAFAFSGYMNAQGVYVESAFYRAYKNGGVYLADECDASDPNATLWLNAALANGHASFPCGMVARHPDTVILASANTMGQGATHEYVGRNKLDSAFLARFPAKLPWDYDETLESATAPDLAWCKIVQATRRKIAARGIRVVAATPRATYEGAKAIASGLSREMVAELFLREGMTQAQWDEVKP